VQHLNLNGIWNLRYADPGQGESEAWPALGVDGPSAIAATVPGDVHEDLVRAGLLDEPLIGENVLACRWVEARDWWYSRTFVASRELLGHRCEIEFEGLDTTADIWLNGVHVGHHDNMFRPLIVNVTHALREGENLLVVRLDIGLRSVADKPAEVFNAAMRGDPTLDSTSPWMWTRKVPFAFSWDWAPRLMTCGIWRGVSLHSYRSVALRDVCLRTEVVTDGRAKIAVAVDVESFLDVARPAVVRVSLTERQDQEEHSASVHVDAHPGRGTFGVNLDVPDPKLWWPRPLGEPRLYDARVSLEVDGRLCGDWRSAFGIREISLLRRPLGEEEGESFTIAVNGVKVFCKGADLIPADAIVARVSPAKSRALVRMAAEANFNMFRLWGGGGFQTAAFYEQCDSLGIMVWQDFQYAYAYYPFQDREFEAEAEREAESALIRLRNHASIVLWCGNNEDQWGHFGTTRAANKDPRPYYADEFYEHALADICARLDPSRPYWPGSPWGGHDPNSPRMGDRHSWNVTLAYPMLEDRISYERYAEDRGKFITEFGVLGAAPLASIQQFLPEAEVHPASSGWAFHNNKQDRGAVAASLDRYWPLSAPLDVPTYVLRSQLLQAEALAFALEHWRRRMFKTSGALFWMFNDCWGATQSWTVVDYFLRKKPNYYFVRRAFAPVLASLQQHEDRVAVWVINDRRYPWSGTLHYGMVDLADSRIESHDCQVRLEAGSSAEVAAIALTDPYLREPERWVAFCRLEADGQTLSRARRYLVGFHFGRLAMPEARFTWHLEGPDVVIMAETYLWNCQFEGPRSLEVEDNYFDLLPGERRSIRVHGPRELLSGVRLKVLNSPGDPSSGKV
jgi:beta-mannosidase